MRHTSNALRIFFVISGLSLCSQVAFMRCQVSMATGLLD